MQPKLFGKISLKSVLNYHKVKCVNYISVMYLNTVSYQFRKTIFLLILKTRFNDRAVRFLEIILFSGISQQELNQCKQASGWADFFLLKTKILRKTGEWCKADNFF